MAYIPTQSVAVSAWGKRIGALAPQASRMGYLFEYDPEWVALGIEIAPLTMPTSRRRHSFEHLGETTYNRLPPAIADSLPDDFGRSVLNAYLAKDGISQSQITPLDRLAYLASRGMGALEFAPDRGQRDAVPSVVDVSELVEVLRRGVQGLFDHDSQTKAALTQLFQVGTSAGGARAKAVIAWNPSTDEIRSGQVAAPAGFEHWLLKFDGSTDDGHLGAPVNYGRIEYAYNQMASAAGIDMMPCQLLEEGGRAHFMTKRFDRAGNDRVHVSTLCGMAQLDFRQVGAHDYSQLFMTIDELGLGAEARREAFRRMVFNAAAANCDDHTKNHAFTMTPDGSWALAPAYDVTHSFRADSAWVHQHAMAINGKFMGATVKDLETVADRFVVPGYRDVIGQVVAAVQQWPDHAHASGLDPGSTKVEEITRDIAEMTPR